MARASKVGVDIASRDARRAAASGHLCKKCGNMISHGELIMVQTLVLGERGRSIKQKSPYHKGCYRT